MTISGPDFVVHHEIFGNGKLLEACPENSAMIHTFSVLPRGAPLHYFNSSASSMMIPAGPRM